MEHQINKYSLGLAQDFTSPRRPLVNHLSSALGGITFEGGYVLDNKLPNIRDFRGHLPDGVKCGKVPGDTKKCSNIQGKLPTHRTFSNESPYANAKTPGGVWEQGVPNADGKLVDRYTPSLEMVNEGRTQGLPRYFQNVEQGNILKPPIPVRSGYFKR